MSDTENTTLAGDGANASLAGDSASATTSSPLTIDAAAEMLGRVEERDEGTTTSEAADDTRQPATSADAEGNGSDEDGGAAKDALAGADGEDTPDDPDAVPFDRLHGNTKIILRDNSVWTVSELKRRIEDVQAADRSRQEIEAQRAEFTTQQSQFQQAAAQLAQRAQFFEQIAPQAIAAIQAQLPEIPEMPRYDPRDPYLYVEQKAEYDAILADYNGKVAQIQQIQQAQAQQAQERQQHQQQATEGFIKEQQRLLFDKVPDLRDNAKRKAFEADFLKHGTETYGFTVDELGSTYDHRLIRMAKDAIAYRELMSRPAKPAQPAAPARPAVPVAQPGRRVTGSEAATARTQELRSRANKPGGVSMEEALSVLSQASSFES